jgi:hypothetical protein
MTGAVARTAFGPWSPDLCDPVELALQLRLLAGVVACHCGSSHPLIDTLRAAETDHTVLQHAAAMFDRLPSLTARRVISTFHAVNFGRGRR